MNGAGEKFQRVLDAISGRDDPTLATLAPDDKLLRVFDLAAGAIRALATTQPVALFVDDLQWADEDSVRMLRYVVRTDSDLPIFLGLTTRAEKLAEMSEAVTLIADMERMGLVRRLRLERFSQLESAELVQQILGGRVSATSAATMHAQAEGVAFIVEELARTYRETGMIQEIDGSWTLARNASRLLPSAVRTLIQRRAARLPDETKQNLADAAVLGRSFSLKDVHSIKLRLGSDEKTCEPEVLAESLAPAIAAGLLVEHPAGSPADYSFTHDQVREFAAALLPAARRRAIHTALVDMLIADGDPPAESMSLLAHHALAGEEPSELSATRSRRRARRSMHGRRRRCCGSSTRRSLRHRRRRIALRCSLQRMTPSACSGGLPTGSRASRSSPHWPRRSAIRIWGSTSSCAGLPHFASPRTRSRRPSSRGVRDAAHERGDRAAELAAVPRAGAGSDAQPSRRVLQRPQRRRPRRCGGGLPEGV